MQDIEKKGKNEQKKDKFSKMAGYYDASQWGELEITSIDELYGLELPLDFEVRDYD